MSKEYKKHEFCKSVFCPGLKCINNEFKCAAPDDNNFACARSAKHFHKWLKENGYKIFKSSSEDEIVLSFTMKIY